MKEETKGKKYHKLKNSKVKITNKKKLSENDAK